MPELQAGAPSLQPWDGRHRRRIEAVVSRRREGGELLPRKIVQKQAHSRKPRVPLKRMGHKASIARPAGPGRSRQKTARHAGKPAGDAWGRRQDRFCLSCRYTAYFRHNPC